MMRRDKFGFATLAGRGALLATLLATGTGCPSTATLTTAKTVGDGVNDITIAPGVIGFAPTVVGGTGSAETSASTVVPVPVIDLAYRRGIGDSFDLGITLSGYGKLRVDGKINFLDLDMYALSIDPGIGGFFAAAGDVGGGYLQYEIPVLNDIAITRWFRIVVAPKFTGIYVFAASGNETAEAALFFVGANTGFDFRINQTVSLMPFAGIDVWLNPPDEQVTTGTTTTSASTGGFLLNGGLAVKLAFGGPPRKGATDSEEE